MYSLRYLENKRTKETVKKKPKNKGYNRRSNSFV